MIILLKYSNRPQAAANPLPSGIHGFLLLSTHLFRALGSVAALATCHWGLYVRPRRQPPPVLDVADGLSSEEAGSLQERIGVLLQARRPQDALPLQLQLLATFPRNPAYLHQAAELQGQLGQRREEAALWERFLLVAPDPGEACPGLPNAYRDLGQLKAAIDASERIAALVPGQAEPQVLLARALEADQQHERARRAYERVLALNPANQDARVGAARMLLRAGEAAPALGMVAPVLATDPDHADALLVQGMALRRLGQLAKARAVLEHGLRLKPQYGDFMLVLAGIAQAQHQSAEAEAWRDRYLVLHPEDAQVRARRAKHPRKAPG